MLQVYILTRCESPQSLYGSLLVFPTLRTGFPTARIHVFENSSHPEAREPIKAAALKCQAEFTQLEREVGHHGFLEDIVNRQEDGTAVFVDPDICFWSNVESWRFDALVAGRMIPRFRCEYTRCLVHPRVHTSLFWVPDVRQLRDAIYNLRHREFFYRTDGVVAKVKYDVWERFQKPLMRRDGKAFFELQYRSLEGHALWVPDEERKHFGPRQTAR